MQGDAESRNSLGVYEKMEGNYDRALRHWMISAKMGEKNSLENIKDFLLDGFATKEQYIEALKGYQDAVEETRSHDRDVAKEIYKF